jgi:hypothetical protein
MSDLEPLHLSRTARCASRGMSHTQVETAALWALPGWAELRSLALDRRTPAIDGDDCASDLTLSPLEAGRFFLHPARLLIFLRGERRGEAVCPEAFSESGK